jgi:hypothetical protein
MLLILMFVLSTKPSAMKKLVLQLTLLLCSLIAGAQTTQDLIGGWKFYTIKTPPGTTKSQYDGATSIMGSIAIHLNADKSYAINLMGMTEKGRWELKDKEIAFTTSDGKNYSFTVTSYEKNLITIDKQKFTVVLSRVGADVPPPPAFREVPVLAKVTTAQVAKKWYLKEFPAPPNMTEKQKEEYGERMSGSFVEFKANGQYTSQIGTKKTSGKWHLNPENNGILTLPAGSNVEILTLIKSVNPTELISVDKETFEEWMYSTIE